MVAHSEISEFGSFPAVSDNDYDNYEGFDAFPIWTMPTHVVDSAIRSSKKEIVYI